MTLVVMAAGMGSRYGGLKQIDPIGPNGEIIIEYSIYDAIKAGFKKVVFIIKEELLGTFEEIIGNKIKNHIEVEYVFQNIHNLPANFSVPSNRIKPWGTGHAILCSQNSVSTPFVVINADDFYGFESYQLMYDYFSSNKEENKFAMAGFQLKNTLTEFGTVARGICELNTDNELLSVTERIEIKAFGEDIKYLNNEKQWIKIPNSSLASMNFWGFKPSIFKELEEKFPIFLKNNIFDPKSEFFIPMIIDELIKEKKISVKVLKTNEQWYGVTYKEDKKFVEQSILKLIGTKYPNKLWE